MSVSGKARNKTGSFISLLLRSLIGSQTDQLTTQELDNEAGILTGIVDNILGHVLVSRIACRTAKS